MDCNVEWVYTIADLVEKTRSTLGVRSKILYAGIGIISRKKNIRTCVNDLDKLSWDYILGRLGISNMVYEGYVYSYELTLYELHMKLRNITNQIRYVRYFHKSEKRCEQKVFELLEEAKKIISKYRKILNSRQMAGSTSKQLHEFYLMKIETYLIVGAELVDKHERFQERRNCITNTWELFHKENCFSAEQMKFENMFLSPAELECLLQAAELLMDEGNFQQAERLLNKLWEYRNHHQQDENEQVKIYPYIAWQLALCKKCQNKKIDFQLVERAMELSIRAGKLYGVVPLMEILLEDRDWAGDREQLKMQHNALIECGRLADANLYSIYPMFSIEGMFLVNEVVRKKRIERKITQEQLCEEIMSQNWYSKFENGAFTTRWFTTELLLMELELPFQRQWLKLDTDDAKAFRLQQMCYKNIHQFQYELMDEHYMSLRRMIDMNSIINQQFCEYMDIIVAEAVLKQVDLKKRNAQAMKSLKRTVKNFSEKDLDRELFSELEKRLINSYACSMDNKYRTTDLLHKIIKNTYNTEEFIDYPSSYQYTLEMNYWIHVAITERLNKTIKPKIKCAQRLLRSGISEELVYVITTILADIHEAFPKSPNSAYICRIWYNYVLYIAQLTRTIAGIVYAQNFGDDIS